MRSDAFSDQNSCHLSQCEQNSLQIIKEFRSHPIFQDPELRSDQKSILPNFKFIACLSYMLRDGGRSKNLGGGASRNVVGIIS